MFECNNSFALPALEGVQAKRKFYVCMCSLAMLQRIFIEDENNLPAIERAQRLLVKSRIPSIEKYIHQNRNDYAFSSISSCLEGDFEFHPSFEGSSLGTLLIDISSKFYIADGQHRKAAIVEAVKADPSLANESISMVIFIRESLKKRQRVFRDLNVHQVKTSKSYDILYSGKTEDELVKYIVDSVPFLSKYTSVEDGILGVNNKEIFTYAGIKKATKTALGKNLENATEEDIKIYIKYLTLLSNNFRPWQLLQEQLDRQSRRGYVCFNTLFLVSFSKLGREIMHSTEEHIIQAFQKLSALEFSRDDSVWIARCMGGKSIQMTYRTITLTCNLLKLHLGLSLSPEEADVEREVK